MIKLKELVKLYKEMDFKSQKAFQKYAAKHKMRKTTKVTTTTTNNLKADKNFARNFLSTS